MFDCLTTLPHGLRVFVEALLYGLQYILMLPARDAPLHAGGAALLERTVATRICPIASQLLPVLLVRIVVLQLFASRTAAARTAPIPPSPTTPAATGTAQNAKARRQSSGSLSARPSCCRYPTSTWCSRCRLPSPISPTRTRR